MKSMWLVLAFLVGMLGTVWAQNPTYQYKLNDSTMVYQRVYAPGLWKQTFDSNFPTSVQYTPVSTTEGPNVASVSFSPSTTQSLHFTMFLAHNMVPANMDAYIGQSCDASHTAGQKVVWRFQMWKVNPSSSMASIVSTNANVDTYLTVTPAAAARVYEVSTFARGIAFSKLRGFDTLNCMFLVRLTREVGHADDNCTAAVSLHWFGIKGYSLASRWGVGF